VDTTNILKRGNSYYVRVAIPRHIQDAIGKREIVRSLHTRKAKKHISLARGLSLKVSTRGF